MRAERDEPDQRDDTPRPRRWGRLVFLFALAVVLVGGGAWAWLVYGKHVPGLLAKSGGDGVPVVRADPSPSKVRPRDPGGMEVPDRDKLVYERLQGEGAEPRIERLLPPAEAPLRPPRAAPVPQVKERLAKVPTEAQVRAAVPPPLPPLARAPEPASAPEREPTPEDSPPTDIETAPAAPLASAPGAQAPNTKDPAASVAPGLVSGRPAPPGAQAPNTKDPAASVAPGLVSGRPAPPGAQAPNTKDPPPLARPEPPARAERGESGYLIQIAAVREPERADAEWERLQRQHPEMLRGLKLFVARADLGDKGVFWRLRAGPFADETAAKNRCAELSRRKVGCLVVKAQG